MDWEKVIAELRRSSEQSLQYSNDWEGFTELERVANGIAANMQSSLADALQAGLETPPPGKVEKEKE